MIIRDFLLTIIDFFYPPFRKIIGLQTFRYAACGGGNTVLDILLFFVAYNYILDTSPVHIGWLTISPHLASFMISFTVTFPIGFYLSRYVVFHETSVRKTKQLFRYFMVVLGCIFLNYIFLKLFVDALGWNATVAKIVTTFFVVIFSYTSQKNFTFKSSKT